MLRLQFCHLFGGPAALQCWTALTSLSSAAHPGCAFLIGFQKIKRKKITKVLYPLRRLHLSMCLSLLDAEFPSILSGVEALKCCCSQRGATEVATPCGDSYRCLELSGCCYLWKGAGGMPLPTSMSRCLSVLVAVLPQLSPAFLCCHHTS